MVSKHSEITYGSGSATLTSIFPFRNEPYITRNWISWFQDLTRRRRHWTSCWSTLRITSQLLSTSRWEPTSTRGTRTRKDISRYRFQHLFTRLWIRIDLMHIRMQHFFLIADPDSVPDPGFWSAGIFFTFWSKIVIYLSLSLHKGRPSHRRSLQLSKENIQHFTTWKFFTFFYFCG